MHDLTFPLSKPKQSLFDAAEQLFAERGFESVAVRDIAGVAKLNIAAVNYHFGSRDALMSLIVTRCISPVNEGRLARLDKLERSYPDKIVPLEEVVDAFVRPFISAERKSELSERLFYKLIGHIFAMQGRGLPSVVEDQIQILNNRFIRALDKSLPSLAVEDLVWRVHFMIGGMIRMLVQQDLLHQISHGASGNPTMEATLSRFVSFAAAGLREGVTDEVLVLKGPQSTFDF